MDEVISRFERHAEQAPDSVAVLSGDTKLTYRELDMAANKLAHVLMDRGIGREAVVGVGMGRGPELVIGLLAVLKADGVYFPLDHTLPGDRLGRMAELASPRLALMHSRVQAALPALGCPILTYDTITTELTAAHGTAPARQATPDNAAYVVFTSGSTGDPKGIVLAGQTLIDLVGWSLDRNPLPRRTAQLASVGFDVSVQEMIWTLAAGGTLVIGPDNIRFDPPALAQLLAAEEVDSAHLPPALLQQLASAWLERPVPLRLKQIYVAGEALAVTPEIRDFLAGLGDVLLQNEYGMSEAQVVTAHSLTGPVGQWPVRPPIGTAVSQASVYLLDERINPVCEGETGEIYIASEALARCYAGRPDLTAERFVANPFGRPGSKMYRSGDVGRRRPDGVIECLGRADQQINLHGHRIEPGEIDVVLAEHHAVTQTATTMKEGAGGEALLVSYVVGQDDGGLVAELRTILSGRLPGYMVPNAIVVLDEMPMSGNRKIDYQALPSPTAPSTSAARPMTPREEVLCGMFSDVLGGKAVGPDDHFRELGGNSLLATKLMLRVRAVFDVDLPVQTFFAEPTVAAIAEYLGCRSQVPDIPRAYPRPEHVPLSHAQQRLLMAHQLENQSSAFNIRIFAHLRGTVDVPALQAAVADVLSRHEAMRTLVVETADGPSQVVTPVVVPALPLSPASDEAVRAFTGHEFDLGHDAPVRAALFASAAGYTMVLVANHIAVDGWSVSVLCRDIGAAYTGRTTGRPPDWRPLPVQYADFTLWQRKRLSADSTQEKFWRATLSNLPDCIELPADHPRPPVRSGRTEHATIHLGAATHQAIIALAAATDTTVFMVLHAALAAFLHRMGAGPDIPIGTPVAGRQDESLTDLVGCFINLIVLRTDLRGNPNLRELLARVRETDLAALAHQDLPFDHVVDVVRPTRSPAHHPLFQVLLAFDNTPSPQLDMPGVTASVDVELGSSQADLTVDLAEHTEDGRPAGLTGALLGSLDLFDLETVGDLARRLELFISGLVSAPDEPLDHIALTSALEHETLLAAGIGDALPWPDLAVHELFEQQAARTPDAIAVEDGRNRLSYAELDANANRLAHRLIAAGASPEQRVAVILPPSGDFVVAVLAVLKSGAAFVPIDPAVPAERARFLRADCRPTLVICADDFPVTDETPSHSPVVAVSVSCAAYLIYTSGSTGLPKGVVVTHRSLANYLGWARRAYPGLETASVLHMSVSVDTAALAVFGPLVQGGRVRVGDLRGGGTGLEGQVGCLEVTPSHLPLLKQVPPDLLPDRCLLVGGESLSAAAITDWRAANSGVIVINAYGPTETTIGVAEWRLEPGTPLETDRVPIGTPVANTRLYVLDERLRPVPNGVRGELYVAGLSVARGYWDRPALTAERFVANPFGPPGERMYRTGDSVRRGRHGDLVFLGRTDDQVQVRGFRVEPGETEACLATHPHVGRAVVIPAPEPGGGTRLAGYVVPAAGPDPDARVLRGFLAERLPRQLVPDSITILGELPMTTTGKVDRRRLPAPSYPAMPHGRGPRTRLEELLCRIVAGVLAAPDVGIDDNFFELGGNSVAGARLVSRLRSELGSTLTLRDLFAAPTVARLAGWMDAGLSAGGMGAVLPLRTTGEQSPLFCVHPVSGTSWCYAGLVRHIAATHPVYGLQSPRLAGAKTPDSVRVLAKQYLQYVRKIAPTGPYHLLGWSFGGVVAHEMAVQLREEGDDVGLLALLDSDLSDNDTAPPEAGDDDSRRALLLANGVSAMELGTDVIAAVAGAIHDNYRLQEGHSARVFDGSIDYFTATRNRKASWSGAQQWRPYVTGDVRERPVPYEHLQLGRPQALEVVAHAIRDHLEWESR